MKPLPVLALLLIVSWFGLPSVAQAHALGAEAKLKDGIVNVEAYFSDDTAAADAKVQVLDQASKVVLEGRTDKKGQWAFPTPHAGKYRFVVDDGAGHRTTFALTIPGTPQPSAAMPAETELPSATKDPDSVVVSEGAGREEFTRTPWLKLAFGITTIALVGVATVFGLRKMGRRSDGATQ